VGSLSFTLQKTLEETTAILGKGNVIFESFPGIIGGIDLRIVIHILKTRIFNIKCGFG
jgi:hypothetical protein